MTLKPNVLSLFIVLLIFSLASCSKDSSSNPSNNNNQASSHKITATITGAITKSFNCTTASYVVVSINGATQTSISGYDGNQTNGYYITMNFVDLEMKPQTIDVQSSTSSVIQVIKYTNSTPEQFMALAGTITLTEYTASEIKGTFEFSGKSLTLGTDFQVTDGTFDITK